MRQVKKPDYPFGNFILFLKSLDRARLEALVGFPRPAFGTPWLVR